MTDPETIRKIRLMRLLSMARKIMAEMVEDEQRVDLNKRSAQREYVAFHQQFNDLWWPCFRPMHIDDYTPQQILEQLDYEMRLVYLSGDYPGQDAIVPAQRGLHKRIEAERKKRKKR